MSRRALKQSYPLASVIRCWGSGAPNVGPRFLSPSIRQICALPSHCRRLSLRLSAAPLGLRRISGLARQLRALSTAPQGKGARYEYQVAAAFSAKSKQFDPKNGVYCFKGDVEEAAREQEELMPVAGQDAFFISQMGSGEKASGGVAAGVADGVGGYQDIGIDPALFSRGLCRAIARHSSQNEDRNDDPKALMASGYKHLVEEGKVSGGASTACLGVFQPSGKLVAANLGDSGFTILRQGRVLYASTPQTHGFNCPLQLAIVTPKLRCFNPLADSPEDSEVTSHDLCHGDVVIFATDGVWDNLTVQQILRGVTQVLQSAGAWVVGEKDGIKVADASKMEDVGAKVARAVAEAAKVASLSSTIDGPFAREVQMNYPYESWRGGKKDDICVVCALALKVPSD